MSNMQPYRKYPRTEHGAPTCFISLRTFLYIGLYLLSKLSRKSYVPTLVYHSIGSNGSFFTVTPHEFARQIEYLKRNYTIVSLEDVFEYANGDRELPNRSV